ncbi:MAG: DNA polymerase III subunit delta [Drouetiella hepatica Uher 2000/2452]|jgi:DNA polymerase-3 subunit delta|uniref:DNA polymerase III subunit delta n=1 Tax=Drouetiella hepatica Uher 2000/2452 TaxID=904376 RepID=A0A951QCN5_9CYAN|nr:DNA polymerase III subunit delta [Drouetiella hepatica Uher 2000/2452]
MSVYLFWGDDDFALDRAVKDLRDRTLDPDWASFNYDKLPPDASDAVVQGINLALTPPFGAGQRLVWLADTTLCQRCSEELLSELERSLPTLPDTTVLLLTTSSKPDGRIKSTKLLQKHAEIREFTNIPPWKMDLLAQQVRRAAQDMGVKLTSGAVQLLAESVGNNSRQLFMELEKLRLYGGDNAQPLGEAAVTTLVTTSTQNSLQLAAAIRQGDTGRSLTLITDLIRQNESPLRIVAVLVGQFRTWLWVKLMLEAGERDEREIAQAAEISNPKRIYFLQQEVKPLSLLSLQQTLPLLLELEFGLKTGAEPLALLQTKAIELCQLYRRV